MKELRQACSPLKQRGNEDPRAQPTPPESSRSETVAPPSCRRSSRSSGLGRQKQRERSVITGRSDETEAGLSWV